MKSKKDMIDDIMLVVKASMVSTGNVFFETDDVLLALVFKSEPELRMICRDLYIGVN